MVNEIKMSEQAVLVTVKMTKFANRITDKVTAGEISEQKKARAGSTRVAVDLTDNAAIKALQVLYGHINNNIIKLYALPWAKGVHLLPAKLIEDFERDINAAIAEWNDLVKQVEQTYAESVDRARQPAPVGLGKLFNERWFPSVESVVSKYSRGFEYATLSSADHLNDIRVTLPQGQIDKMKADLERNLEEAAKNTNIEVHKRITSALDSLIDGLKRHGTKAKGAKRASKFTDNTVVKLNELADVAKKLNVTGDARLDNAINEIKKDLTDLRPDELRESKTKRKDVAKKAKKIVDDLDGLF